MTIDTPHTVSPPEEEKRPNGRSAARGNWLLAISAALCVVISACYGLQPDWLAPVTLVPPLYWLVPAAVLTVYGLRGTPRLWSLAVLGLWAAFAFAFVEEPWSLARSLRRPDDAWQAARERGRGIRIVSLNCLGGNPAAAAEVAAWEPDIVLLQESPTESAVERLARELFGEEGSFVWGGDTSILARGRIRPRHVDRGSPFVHAAVELPEGVTLDVASVRLHPPVFRLDFWRPGFWIAHRNIRAIHRRQILGLMESIGSVSTPLVVGGDFNAPPRDGSLQPLTERLRDTFPAAGRGWGNTGTNDVPLFRVDQIWASPHLRAVSTTARRTVHSDHRMVVCDLVVE